MLDIFKKKNSTEDLEQIHCLLNNIEDFIDRDINTIDVNDKDIKDERLQTVYSKIIKIANKLNNKTTSDLGVNGEMLILIEKMADGDFSDKVRLSTDDPYLNYFAKSLNTVTSKLHSNFIEILHILKEYERGIYIKSLSEETFRDGEVKEFLKGINSLKDSIANILRDNFRYGYKLQETSDVLNVKMKKIVAASDKQSKILDEIAHNISDVKSKANSTKEDTKKMQNSSATIKIKANEGLKYASDTVVAMKDINSATEAISEAIEVIDQIAFQTNILSLNAAVEAATAGDAGKGFAVVASEVRNLASRSAEAAKTIKALVEKATQKANEGKDISDNMIDGYNGLITNIDSTIELIDKTTLASNEQSKAIENMDKTIEFLQEETKNYVKIAHQTNEVGLNLNEIAHKILEITDKTEFEGKNLIAKQREKESEPELA